MISLQYAVIPVATSVIRTNQEKKARSYCYERSPWKCGNGDSQHKKQANNQNEKKSFTLFTISSDTHSGAVVRSLTVAS